MSSVLYQLPHSPYCLPITRLFAALGQPLEVRNVSNGDRAELIRLTGGACYQVPVLVEGDRMVFDGSEGGGDGLDLPRYVDSRHAGGRLFPAAVEGLQRLLLPIIEDELEGLTFKLADLHYVPSIADPVERIMVIRHKERRFGRGCLDQWRDQREALFSAATRRLEPFALMLEHHPFLLGTAPVYADFALWGVLANLTWKDANPLPPLPPVEAWYRRLGSYRFS
ncbi:MAG: glutathione S-transferase family protein [Verrucomicrobiota bacterium]